MQLSNISNEGIYNEENNSLSWNEIKDDTDLSYDFSKEVKIGNASSNFSGTVTKSVIYDPYITIEDENLRNVILDKLNKDYDYNILRSDLESITDLDASNKGIKSLAGLEYCSSLKTLNISGNEVTDISPLNKIRTLEKADASNQSLTYKASKFSFTYVSCSISNAFVSYDGTPLTSFTNISNEGTYLKKSNSIKWKNLYEDCTLSFEFIEKTSLLNGGECIFSGKGNKEISFK